MRKQFKSCVRMIPYPRILPVIYIVIEIEDVGELQRLGDEFHLVCRVPLSQQTFVTLLSSIGDGVGNAHERVI